MARRVVALAVLLLSGCVGEGRLSSALVHPCRAAPDQELGPGETYAWVNQTVVDLATQGWGFTSIRLVPCRTVEANFAVVSLPGATNQNPGGEPYSYVLVLVFPEDGEPARPDSATGDASTFLKWETPTPGGQSSPLTNDWTMFLQGETAYRLVVATNVNGYRVQMRDLNPAVNSSVPWTSNLTLSYRGPMGQELLDEHPAALGQPPFIAQSARAWRLDPRPGAPAFLLVRSWFDASANRGNYTDEFKLRLHSPEATPDHSYRKEGNLGVTGESLYTLAYAGALRADSIGRIQRSLHTTTSGLTEPNAGLATLLVPLFAEDHRA